MVVDERGFHIKHIRKCLEKKMNTKAIWEQEMKPRGLSERAFYRLLKEAKNPEGTFMDHVKDKLAKRTIRKVIEGKILLKNKVDRISEMEHEIEELMNYVKQGYILRDINIEGIAHRKLELLMSSELKALHQAIDNKRAEVAKMSGDYAPQQKEVKMVKDLAEKTPTIVVTNGRYSSTITAKGQQSTDNQDK